MSLPFPSFLAPIKPDNPGSLGKWPLKRREIVITCLAHTIESGLESFGEVPIGDGVENAQHRILVEVVDGDDLEVTHEPRADVITTAARRTHRSHEYLHGHHRLASPLVITVSHGSATCCKGDAASQWEMAILGVSELRNP